MHFVVQQQNETTNSFQLLNNKEEKTLHVTGVLVRIYASVFATVLHILGYLGLESKLRHAYCTIFTTSMSWLYNVLKLLIINPSAIVALLTHSSSTHVNNPPPEPFLYLQQKVDETLSLFVFSYVKKIYS